MALPFFQPVPRWTMDQAKQFMAEHELTEYNLVDVRQPAEYEQEHIPGATLIPLGELGARLGELDRAKPTLVYCYSGGRAGNGAALLSQAGFAEVHNIGGIPEWHGLVASGAPEAAMAVFDAARAPEEYIALAWEMEEGARLFYLELAGIFTDQAAMFEPMAKGEEKHRDQLTQLHQQITGGDGEPRLDQASDLMEGGIERSQALAWARDAKLLDVLEFAAAMEANAHDRYILVGRAVGGEVERAFVALAEAEKVHMDQLLKLFSQIAAKAS